MIVNIKTTFNIHVNVSLDDDGRSFCLPIGMIDGVLDKNNNVFRFFILRDDDKNRAIEEFKRISLLKKISNKKNESPLINTEEGLEKLSSSIIQICKLLKKLK